MRFDFKVDDALIDERKLFFLDLPAEEWVINQCEHALVFFDGLLLIALFPLTIGTDTRGMMMWFVDVPG